MNIKGIRLPVVVLTVVMVLAVLFGIQYIYHKVNVEQPLFKLYSQTKAVQKFEIDNKSNVTEVNIDLKKTDNLQQTYQKLYLTTVKVLGKNNFQLKIKDNRNKDLENAYYSMQFIINEALMRGNFSQMAQVINEKASETKAVSKVFIDDQNIYIQLEKENSYLYEIVPRVNNDNGTLTVQKGAGGVQNG